MTARLKLSPQQAAARLVEQLLLDATTEKANTDTSDFFAEAIEAVVRYQRARRLWIRKALQRLIERLDFAVEAGLVNWRGLAALGYSMCARMSQMSEVAKRIKDAAR